MTTADRLGDRFSDVVGALLIVATLIALAILSAGCVTTEITLATGPSAHARGGRQDVGHVASSSAEATADVPVALVPK